jgi:uncharacterized membrane protein YsdA (DUF1294 family)
MIHLLLLILNGIVFGVFGYDKFSAKKHQRRIPENVLFSLTFFGGTIGAAIGMLVFRHKISKKSFLLKWGSVVVIQIVIIYAWNFLAK